MVDCAALGLGEGVEDVLLGAGEGVDDAPEVQEDGGVVAFGLGVLGFGEEAE
jgi:hypothetical protein